MVCAEVKDFGLQLDPFDSVPLDIRTGTGTYIVYIIIAELHINIICTFLLRRK